MATIKKNINRKWLKPQFPKLRMNCLSPRRISRTSWRWIFKNLLVKFIKFTKSVSIKRPPSTFDDLLSLDLSAASKKMKPFVKNIKQQFLHVLVDEYQDTNKVQYFFNQITCSSAKQSLSQWEIFLKAFTPGVELIIAISIALAKTFPDIKEYRLERNYRSKQNILDAATQVIKQNQSHPILGIVDGQQQ